MASRVYPITRQKKPWTGDSAHGLYETLRNAAVGELRQDDGLPCGTKVVPVAAAINPLIAIKYKGSHRQRFIPTSCVRSKLLTMLYEVSVNPYEAVAKIHLQRQSFICIGTMSTVSSRLSNIRQL